MVWDIVFVAMHWMKVNLYNAVCTFDIVDDTHASLGYL